MANMGQVHNQNVRLKNNLQPILSQSIDNPQLLKEKKKSSKDLFGGFGDEEDTQEAAGLLTLKKENSIMNSQVIIKHGKKLDDLVLLHPNSGNPVGQKQYK